MSRSIRLALVSLVAWGGLSLATPAEAHGWHHHRHGSRPHHRGALWRYSYAPQYRFVGVSLWPWGCQLRRYITPYGTLAYREACF